MSPRGGLFVRELFYKVKLSLILKKIKRTSNFEYLVEYMNEIKSSILPTEVISDIVDMLCNKLEEHYIYTLTSRILNFNIDNINKLSCAMLKTNSSNYIMKYFILLNKRSIKGNNDIFIKRLCELKDVRVLKSLLLENINLTNEQRLSLFKTVVQNDSLENILVLTNNINDLTLDEKRIVVSRVCCDVDPYYICLFSILFDDIDKQIFINAMMSTNNAEHLYYFIKYNKNLDINDINLIVDKLCSLNNIEYIYKTLELVSDEQTRCKLLKRINDAKDLKYLCLAYFYTDGIETDEKFNINKLYPYMIDSNLYTSNELVDAYKIYMKRKENN